MFELKRELYRSQATMDGKREQVSIRYVSSKLYQSVCVCERDGGV